MDVASMCFLVKNQRDRERGHFDEGRDNSVRRNGIYTSNGRSYILVFNEALYMKDIDHNS